jgi:YVTN family beta-propeller protein
LELKVFLAGRVAVEANGVLVGEERFPGRQGRLLFAYLVSEEGRPVPRDELGEALWGNAPPMTWEKALAVLVSKLRGLLGECGVDGAAALTSAFGCYRLNLPPGSWVDVPAAASAAQEAEQALAADDLEKAKVAAMRAASLARQPFLPGEEGAWVDERRRELTDVRSRALGCLADACLRSGDPSEAAKWAGETIALEPFRETGYRRLMEANAAAGNRAEALRVYERCRTLLAEELGAYPSPETESIYRELLGGSSAAVRAAAPEATRVAVREGESEQQAQAAVPLRRFRGRRVLVGIGAVLLLAAIAVSIIEFTGGGNRTLVFVAANSLAAVDSRTNRLVADVKVGDGPTSVAGDEGAVWVANRDDNTVSRLDVRTNTLRQTIKVGGGPSGVAVGAGAVWVANGLDGTVSRIDPETNEVVQEIAVGNTPSAIAFGEGAVWVANADDRTVWKLDPASGDVLLRVPVDAAARGIAVGGGAVWLTDPVGNALVRLDTRTKMVTRVNVGSGPTAVAFGAGSVWVANNLDGTVSRVDADRRVMTNTVQVGVAPNGIAVTRNAVWVTDEAAGTLVRIDPRSREPKTWRHLGGRPEGVAPADGSAWVAVQAGGAAHRGGTLRLMCAPCDEIDSIDPARAYSPDSWRLLSVTGDGLVGFKRVGGAEGNTLVPDLARALPVPTESGRTYTFQLRDGLRFSTGRPVEASDVRYTFERLSRAGARPDVPDFYVGILGGRVCKKRPKRCDLSRGIVTDDASRTVTFHLRTADPEFLDKLALPFASLVPAGTPAVGKRPVPGTGPYRIARYEPKRLLRLVRNPYFRVWSSAAQPQGNPDAIALRFSLSVGEGVTAVERGRADWTTNLPTGRLEELRTRYAAQVHITPQAVTHFVQPNTTRPPFDNPLARRAVNYAVDRARIVELAGGTDLAVSTCQILPPNFPGYRPFCPYTANPGPGAWSAPDLARARELVRRSGTKGMRVDMIGFAPRNVFGAETTVVAETLRLLGYRVFLRKFRSPNAYFPYKERNAGRVDAAASFWGQDYPAPSNFVVGLFRCNPYFCDRAFERRMQRALNVQARDPRAANELWAGLERELVNRGIVVPLVNPKSIDFVSRRVGNYQHHPVFGILISRLWVH